jgi:hypothetical protein
MNITIIQRNLEKATKAQSLLKEGKRVWVTFTGESIFEVKQIFNRAVNVLTFFDIEGFPHKSYVGDHDLRFVFEDEIVKTATLDFTEVGLCGHDPVTDVCLIENIPWPKDWPETVTRKFLEEQGFRVEVC